MFRKELTEKLLGDVKLLVRMNGGGSVTVAQGGEGDWVITDTFTTDGGEWLSLGEAPTRIVATGAAEFKVIK